MNHPGGGSGGGSGPAASAMSFVRQLLSSVLRRVPASWRERTLAWLVAVIAGRPALLDQLVRQPVLVERLLERATADEAARRRLVAVAAARVDAAVWEGQGWQLTRGDRRA